MVLGVHGEPVLVRVLRDAARQRPRDEHALVLEAQVPVQAAGVVLLDDEAALVRRRRASPRGSGVFSKSRFASVGARAGRPCP